MLMWNFFFKIFAFRIGKSIDKVKIERQINDWHIPLSKTGLTIEDGLNSMGGFKLEAENVPLIIKLVENPKYDIGLFPSW